MIAARSALSARASEAAALATQHFRKAASFRRGEAVFRARGRAELERQYADRADSHEHEAECLAMFAELCRLGGVTS